MRSQALGAHKMRCAILLAVAQAHLLTSSVPVDCTSFFITTSEMLDALPMHSSFAAESPVANQTITDACLPPFDVELSLRDHSRHRWDSPFLTGLSNVGVGAASVIIVAPTASAS
eukprot:352474-Chlamydomonas_euryale.AAC.4